MCFSVVHGRPMHFGETSLVTLHPLEVGGERSGVDCLCLVSFCFEGWKRRLKSGFVSGVHKPVSYPDTV